MKPQVGSETVGTRRRSRSSGKHGRPQAKIRRKTCDDRKKKTERRGQNRLKTNVGERKNQRKKRPKHEKIDEKSVSAAFGRSGSFPVAPGSRRSALGTVSGGQMEALGEPSWPFGPPCWPPWAPSWQPKTLQTAPGARPEPSANACAVSNSVRFDFSSVFYAMVERPNLNFRQPVQCFVHFGRSSHRTRATGETGRKSRVFGIQNQTREPRNRARTAPGERKAAQEPSKSPRIFKSGAEWVRQSEKSSPGSSL